MPAYRDYKKETGQTFEQIFKQESNYKGELLTLEALNKLMTIFILKCYHKSYKIILFLKMTIKS
jgi:hypothetical protein